MAAKYLFNLLRYMEDWKCKRCQSKLTGMKTRIYIQSYYCYIVFNFVAGQCVHVSHDTFMSRNSIGDGKSLEFYKGHSTLAPGVHQAPHNTYSQDVGALKAPHIANIYAKCSKH